MVGSNLLLHGLDEELRDLGRSKLVPCQGSFGSREDDQSNRMCEVVHGKGICPLLAEFVGRMGGYTKMGCREDRQQRRIFISILLFNHFLVVVLFLLLLIVFVLGV